MAVRPIALAVVGVLLLFTGGCVAAVVPVAAGGLIGHKQLQARHQRQGGDQPPTAVADATPAAAATPVSVRPLPADPAAMKVGAVYSGQLPSPTGAGRPPAVAVAAAMSRAVPAPAVSAWLDVVHYVAAASLNPPTRSVLMTKGSAGAAPIWVACGQKPMAVVIDLDAVGTHDASGHALTSIGAIETMGLTPVYTSDHDVAVALGEAKTLSAHVAAAPVEGRTLFLAQPGNEAAARAAIGARYCAIAVVGTRAADFPNALLPSRPGASPGWFLLPAAS